MTTQATPVPARPAPPSVPRQILVTGASGGIGRATAARLADAGHVVFAAARRAGELQALAATHPGIHPVVLDVTDPAAVDRARHQIQTQTGGHGLDVLINAAGILVLGPVEAVPDPRPGPSSRSTCSAP
jgi:NADP-dependent 3-hydroxy acid dehydrogenase YdfG